VQNAYQIILGVEVFIALLLTAIIFVTGKGDAMGGGASGVRTTFRGKASFDDKISTVIMSLGGAFIVLAIFLDYLSKKIWG
jgi:preprotein translocase subunit SecG